jgi:hypothetical protein
MDDLSFLKNEKQELNQDNLKKLSELAVDLKTLRGEANQSTVEYIIKTLQGMEKSDIEMSIKTLEAVVKAYEQKENNISQILIPTILNECGVSEVRLASGEKLIVSDEIKADIADKNTVYAFAEMIELEQKENGLEYSEAFENVNALFKDSIVLKSLSPEEFKKAAEMLIEEGIPYEGKKDIHWQTLKKYVKTQLEYGKSIPKAINVFKYQKTTLK